MARGALELDFHVHALFPVFRLLERLQLGIHPIVLQSVYRDFLGGSHRLPQAIPDKHNEVVRGVNHFSV